MRRARPAPRSSPRPPSSSPATASAHTRPDRTAKPNTSTTPRKKNGPTGGPPPRTKNAATPSHPGSTTTTTPHATPPPQTNPQSPNCHQQNDQVHLDLTDLVVDGCILKAPAAVSSRSFPRSIAGKAARNAPSLTGQESPSQSWSQPRTGTTPPLLLRPTLECLRRFDELPDRTSVHLDADYDYSKTRNLLTPPGQQPQRHSAPS